MLGLVLIGLLGYLYASRETRYDQENFRRVDPAGLDKNATSVGGYRVQNVGTLESKRKVARILQTIKKKVDNLTRPENLRALFEDPVSKRLLNGRLMEGLKLLQDMHSRRKDYAEISPNTGFFGVNYPFGVSETSGEPLGVDRSLRAKKRVIYLTVRQSPNSFRSHIWLENLVIHELAHTVANHVRYRPDDHGKDFANAEELVKYLWKLSSK